MLSQCLPISVVQLSVQVQPDLESRRSVKTGKTDPSLRLRHSAKSQSMPTFPAYEGMFDEQSQVSENRVFH